MARRQLAVLAAFALLIVQAGGALAAPIAGASPGGGANAAPIQKGLVAALNSESIDRFVVQFSAKADLDGAAKTKGYVKRGRAVLDSLTSTAKQSQAAGLALAKKSHAKAKSYWLLNQLVVQGDAKLAKQFAKLKGVSRVRALKTYPLVKPVEMKAAVLAAEGDPEWGVAKIRAPEAWAEGILGQGVVVSSVDTGVDFTHPALVDHYRGNNGDGTFTNDYNWWDPTGICGDEPCDNAGHGTHTMGTMVGGDGPGPFTPDTGVAPGAKWIAAKGCEEFDCSEESLLSAGQWILAPTDHNGANPDPSKRPDIVNNSWGAGPGDEFYHATVNAWRAAGIIPVFSSGNPGDACGDGGSPGDFNEVFSAGATDIDDNIADFSGRGPSSYGKVNPDISAPGVDVISSVPGGGYESFSGTSMAAPHTSGTIALLLSARPALLGASNAYTATTDAIRATAVDRIDTTCGGDADGDPNNVYGDGRIDAKAAVDLLATGGTLAGDVTDDDSGDPISGAQITAAGADRDFSVTADSDGHYEIFLAAGTYDVTATAFGYATGLATGVEVTTDDTTTTDFALTALPRFNLTGHVLASEDGSALSGAAVTALGTPVAPAIADGSGAYSLNLPVGTYSVRASAGGCTESVVEDGVAIVDQDVDQDFVLGRKLDTFGHGCRTVDLEWVDATTDTSLFGDDFAGRLHLPFTFDFYGVGYDQVFISDNGYLTFGGADTFNPFPSPIPSDATPNGAVYALWRDLYLTGDGQISYTTVGAPGNRAFVIELTDVSVRGSTSTVDLEIKLYEIGETVDILYGDNDPNPGDGRGSTIGIENADGSDALEFSFSDSLVTANTAYRYEVVPTGIVSGTVTDANDDAPIAGASVSASPGLGSTTTAADGSYSLRLYPGEYDLSFTSTGYVSETQDLTIADGDELTRDAALDAPVPTIDPDTVEVELAFGADPVDAHVTLGNDGSAPLTWEVKERNRGSTPPVIPPTINGHGAFIQGTKPAVQLAVNGGGTALFHPRAFTWTAAHPAADMSILVYTDDPVHPSPDTYVDQALQRLNLSYTAHYDGDFDGFQSDLESGTWDLVIFADENAGPDFSLFDSLNAYVVNGGRLIFESWVVEFDPSHALFQTLGFSFAGSVFDEPSPVYWWQPDHPIFTFPEDAPAPTDLAAIGFGIYGQFGDPLPGAEALAGYTTPGPDEGAAALVIANDERTAFKGWVDASNDADLDGDGVPDGVEFWENAANGIGSGFFTDVSWLSESPTDGTLAAGDTQDVTLTIGDPNLAPGEHQATVVFRTDAPKPRSVTVDVTLNVPLPGVWGSIEGFVTDAHTGDPITGVDVTLHTQWDGSPLDVTETTDGIGHYTMLAPGGTWPLVFSKDGYVTITRNQVVAPATATTGVDARLHQLVTHGRIHAGDLTFVLTKGHKDTGTIRLTNPNGHLPLTFEVDEATLAAAPSLAGSATSKSITKVAPLARSTRGANRPAVHVPPKIQSTGDILAAWPTEGLELPWAVGYTGNVWIGSALAEGDVCAATSGCVDMEFHVDGTPTGDTFPTPWAGAFGGDMAYDAGRGLMWQVNVGGDNGIYGVDPDDGTVVQTITGSPWSDTDQRGLAYDPVADVFYIGGWNEGIVYKVAGPSHTTPGETLSQCSPADPSISGLAWNGSFNLLWEATNSETDTIYLIDPATCDTIRAVDHPDPGFNGAGLDLDSSGNLWMVSQNSGLAFLVDSGLPLLSNVPWMTVSPKSGSVAPNKKKTLTVTVNSKGLKPGLYRGAVVIGTNDPEIGIAQVPVTLIVPAYRKGINAGGKAYTDKATDIVYTKDRKFTAGKFGWVGSSSTQSTPDPIAHTKRDPLYQNLRVDMTGYKFKVPNGFYVVDLSFAELHYKKPGGRQFAIEIEGSTVVSGFDVVDEAGGRKIALDETYFVEVSDGMLNINFTAPRAHKPIVNALLVTEMPPGAFGF